MHTELFYLLHDLLTVKFRNVVIDVIRLDYFYFELDYIICFSPPIILLFSLHLIPYRHEYFCRQCAANVSSPIIRMQLEVYLHCELTPDHTVRLKVSQRFRLLNLLD